MSDICTFLSIIREICAAELYSDSPKTTKTFGYWIFQFR